MKQVVKATAHITDTTTKIKETIDAYIELGGKFILKQTENKLEDVKLEKINSSRPEKIKVKPDNQSDFIYSFEDYKPLENKENTFLKPLKLIRQKAVDENIDDVVESDSESASLSVNSVNVEQDQIEEEEQDQIEEEEQIQNIEVIGDLQEIEDDNYKYVVYVNGLPVKFGSRSLPDVQKLKNKFSERKIQIMLSKIKKNYNIKQTDDITSIEFWECNVFLSLDMNYEYRKLQDIYNY